MTERDGDRIDFEAYDVPEPAVDAADRIVAAAMSGGAAVRKARAVWPMVAGGAVVLAAAAVLVVMLRGGDDESATQSVAGDPGQVANQDSYKQPLDPRERDLAREPAERLRVMPSADERTKLLAAIEYARQKRVAGGGGRDVPFGPAGTGGDTVYEKQAIKDAMQEVVPLLQECYQMALENAPKLSGKLIANFKIVGEPDVGGLVAEVELESNDGMTDNLEFSECIRETVYSLELPAPAGGGEVSVKYPFFFRNDPDDDSGSGGAPAPTHTMPDLLTQARDAAKAGEWGKALKLAETVLQSNAADQEALMVAAIAACSLRNPKAAGHYVGRLTSAARAGMARQICLKNGLEIPE